MKRGGRLVKHARYYWLLRAKSHLTRRLFGMMLRRIWALPVPAGRHGDCRKAARGMKQEGSDVRENASERKSSRLPARETAKPSSR